MKGWLQGGNSLAAYATEIVSSALGRASGRDKC